MLHRCQWSKKKITDNLFFHRYQFFFYLVDIIILFNGDISCECVVQKTKQNKIKCWMKMQQLSNWTQCYANFSWHDMLDYIDNIGNEIHLIVTMVVILEYQWHIKMIYYPFFLYNHPEMLTFCFVFLAIHRFKVCWTLYQQSIFWVCLWNGMQMVFFLKMT